MWGKRAEDPFRGLRAGPVRFSPFLFSGLEVQTRNPHFRRRRAGIFRNIANPSDNPEKTEHGGSVSKSVTKE
jgi:hypothetical protein